MMREQLLDRMWANAEPHVYIPKEQFIAALDSWRIYDIVRDGKLVAIVADNGPEFHFQSGGEGAPITRRIACDVVQKLIDAHGYAVTKTPHHMLQQQRFNEAFGFEVTGRDEYDVHYRITKIRGSGSRG